MLAELDILGILKPEIGKRPVTDITLLQLPPSGEPLGTGINAPLFRGVRLFPEESKSMGIPEIAGKGVEVDLLLLDIPPSEESDWKLWRSMISSDCRDVSSVVWRNITESIFPNFSATDLASTGYSLNGRRTTDPHKWVHNRILREYIIGLNQGKRPLFLIGHSYYSDHNTTKMVGSPDNLDKIDYVISALAGPEYSVIVDATCSDIDFELNPAPNNSILTVCPLNEVLDWGGRPNEQQCGVVMYQNGRSDRLSWTELLRQRRSSGKMSNINIPRIELK